MERFQNETTHYEEGLARDVFVYRDGDVNRGRLIFIVTRMGLD